jgi:hypothetical protein
MYLQAPTEWGTLCDLIAASVRNTTQTLIEKKYTNISHKTKKKISQNRTLSHQIAHTSSIRASLHKTEINNPAPEFSFKF